jgi:hypothetical protein
MWKAMAPHTHQPTRRGIVFFQGRVAGSSVGSVIVEFDAAFNFSFATIRKYRSDLGEYCVCL